jgi:urea transport system ATP-binding protein
MLKKIRTLKGLTILVSEQVLSFALSIADRMLVINRGRIIHESSRQETDEGVLKRLLAI